MQYAMNTSCTLKSIVRHHLYMKCGSGFDRTFPDVMMTIVFGWGKTNIQQDFRKDEMNGMDDEQLEFMRNHPTKAIFDYQVSSAERYKHVSNEMFMNGSQDSDSHSPLMVYIRSKSATSKRSSERYQDYIKKKQSSWVHHPLIHLGIQKEAVHSVSHFEGQDISSKQKKDESGTFNHMATAHIKATVKGHEANSISYFVLEIKRNLCLFCVLFFRPLISRNIWLKGPFCRITTIRA